MADIRLATYAELTEFTAREVKYCGYGKDYGA